MSTSLISVPQLAVSQLPTSGQRRLTRFTVLLCCVYLAALVYYATVRRVDADEGFYTTAARLVWQGKTPYKDFFYQQAPLLPYVYSWVWAIRPNSLVAMRILSAVFCATTTALWGFGLLRVKALPGKVALATLLTILLDPYWISWNVVVKTFSFSNLMISLVLVLLYAALHTGSSRWYFAAGLAHMAAGKKAESHEWSIPGSGDVCRRSGYRAVSDDPKFRLGSAGIPIQ
jgi:hypothetical protein